MNFFTSEFWMSLKGLVILLIVCIFVFAGVYYLTHLLYESPNEAGDAAGLANGLFSALAFAGVIFAIFLQQHELQMQRAELEAQKQEFKTQNETLKRQRFENTFFNMLQLQQQITDNISYSYETRTRNRIAPHDYEPQFTINKIELSGREVFRTAFEEVPHFSKSSLETYIGMRRLLAAKGMSGYEHNSTPTYFDHYFRHLYHIFKYIAESPLIRDDDRQEYASMVRAQLSRYELIWLYYNGISEYGRDKFKPIIETFALLHNLRTDMLAHDINKFCSYASEAFNK